eukprot:CAMPEP_0174739024 /NCGR_PEP_ID=MMETSP1094-20130205/70916_1 /TAXON_ID=156173 /ORGANISM="Chrysochromulina brevifilum, Strain UTEX LB 985" /LENGTH=266 /DNA_ID=CAMNT_0015942537 /DNA_START=158 /DNA_END=958 /DNA_ORIENTATION=-
MSSLAQAADATIASLREHPMLLQEVLKRSSDEEVRRAVLASTAEEIFHAADADSDGTITRSEQIAFIASRYPSLSIGHATAVDSQGSMEGPSSTQLRQLFLRTAIPFVGFGFLDNAIMIMAGDQIDSLLGTTLCLSSMAAAGLGNLVSDVCGIQASSVIERWTDAMGLPDPELTPLQRTSASAQWALSLASMIGISIGCILGLSPLLVMEDEDTRACRSTFKKIDVDKSGAISFGELENALHAMGIDLSRSALNRCGCVHMYMCMH